MRFGTSATTGDRLSALDAALLRIERDVQPILIGAVVVLDGVPPTAAELAALLTPRVPLRLRQVVVTGPGRPHWRTVDVDAADHVHPLPGVRSDTELAEVVAGLLERPLRRDRPLWDLHLIGAVPGEASGSGWAVVARFHHAALDGLGGVEALLALLDPRPHDADTATVTSTSPPRTGGRRIVETAGRRRAWGAIAGLARSVGPPERLLSGALSDRREWAIARGRLDLARTVARSHGASVNDVVLAVVGGGVRELLLQRGPVSAEADVRTLVPVSLRGPEVGVPGNIVTGVITALPVGVADPTRRVREVAARTRRLRRTAAAAGPAMMLGAMESLPEPAVAGLVHVAARWPHGWVGLGVTNVPGPRHGSTLAGRTVREVLPCVPLGQRIRLTVAVLSREGDLHCGVTADARHLPGAADVVARGIEAGWDELAARNPAVRSPSG